jgi:hypothetical protein
MNRGKVNEVRAKVESALSDIGNDLGINFKLGVVRFDANGFRTQLRGSEVRDGVVQTPERVAFIEQAAFYGLSADDIDATFDWEGKTYQIVGLRTRGNVKRRIVTEGLEDGRTYHFSASGVIKAMRVEATTD